MPDSPDSSDIDRKEWVNRMLARLNAEGDIPVPKAFEELVTVEDLEFLRTISVKTDSQG
ncbi:MAG: hypothetical protein HYR60_24435 [Acidobacteria bacterium]|nr:hypothetical protein [Acidobacteriota bacterium]